MVPQTLTESSPPARSSAAELHHSPAFIGVYRRSSAADGFKPVPSNRTPTNEQTPSFIGRFIGVYRRSSAAEGFKPVPSNRTPTNEQTPSFIGRFIGVYRRSSAAEGFKPVPSNRTPTSEHLPHSPASIGGGLILHLTAPEAGCACHSWTARRQKLKTVPPMNADKRR